MAGNIQNVSFSPLTAVAPDLQVQQAQIQRQQALAQQLREMSMQDSPANGGAVSWTQGVARLAQALRASKLQQSADSQQIDLGRQQASVLRSMFGMGSPAAGAPAASAPASDPPAAGGNTPSYTNPLAAGLANATSQPIAPGGSPSFASDMGNTMSSLAPEDGSAPPPPPPQTPASSPAPAPTPAVAPSAGAGNSPGPWQLTGSPGQDFSMYAMNPDEYGKAVIAAHAPTDITKQLMQAGIDPNSALGRQYLQANLAKQNYIAPVTARPGGVIVDPVTHQPIFQAAQAPEGSQVNYGPDGKAASISPIAGGAQAVQTAAAAKSFGSAAGDLMQVYDPASGQMVYKPKQQVLQGGAGGASYAAGAPMGAQAAADVTGRNSANEFKTISDGAADVPNRKYALNQMAAIVADPRTVLGPGSEGMNHVAGVLGTLTGTPPPQVNNAQEFGKWAAQYSARSAQELGLSGSDARVQIAIHATPNGEMTKPALAAIIPQMVGLENAKQGQANAAVAWQRTHGAADVQTFRTQWNQVYDPRIYTAMAQGPAAVQHLMKTVSPSDRQGLIRKSQALAAMGALPSGR